MFYCKLKKSSFLHNITKILGFDVTPEGMCISDSKAQILSEWPVPTTVKKVQSFLGFVQYFCRLFCNLSAIAEPLHKLICKNESFAWIDSC